MQWCTNERATLTPMGMGDWDDRSDFDDASRGFIGALEPPVITNARGNTAWDGTSYAFLDGECPSTAHPSLWRQGQLCAKHGLYEVTERIYQVRGYDLSNMTIVEGDRGVIVIDPLDLHASVPRPRSTCTAATVATGRSRR